MNAYVIGFEVNTLVEGEEYTLAAFPLHCTLIHWFTTNAQPDLVHSTIFPILNKTKKLTLVFDELALYGLNADIPVQVIKKTEDINALYFEIYNALDALDVTHTIPYIGEKYSPHVTLKQGKALLFGTTKIVENIYLAQATDGGSFDTRKVLSLFTLKD